jgi:ribosome recycling factor
MSYETTQELINDLKKNLDQVFQKLKTDLKKQRTGRANPALLDDLKIESYGVLTSLKAVANISAPEAKLILINPFDKSQIVEIEKAIIHSGLGLAPQSDGKVIRLKLPPLSDERRKEMAKQIRTKGEEFKISVRTIRSDAKKNLQKMEKAKKITEDDVHTFLDKIQKMVDQEVSLIDEQIKLKEKEILETDVD